MALYNYAIQIIHTFRHKCNFHTDMYLTVCCGNVVVFKFYILYYYWAIKIFPINITKFRIQWVSDKNRCISTEFSFMHFIVFYIFCSQSKKVRFKYKHTVGWCVSFSVTLNCYLLFISFFFYLFYRLYVYYFIVLSINLCETTAPNYKFFRL